MIINIETNLVIIREIMIIIHNRIILKNHNILNTLAHRRHISHNRRHRRRQQRRRHHRQHHLSQRWHSSNRPLRHIPSKVRHHHPILDVWIHKIYLKALVATFVRMPANILHIVVNVIILIPIHYRHEDLHRQAILLIVIIIVQTLLIVIQVLIALNMPVVQEKSLIIVVDPVLGALIVQDHPQSLHKILWNDHFR